MTPAARAGMAVDLVTPSFAPRVGGVETAVERLADGLHDDGVDVTVLTHRPRARSGSWPAKPYPVHRFAEWTRSRQFEIAPGLWWQLRRDRGRGGLVHAHSFHGSAALLATATARPLVFSPHFHGVGHTVLARLAHLPYDRLARRIFDRAAAVICVSAAEAELVAGRYPQGAEKTVVVPNGVDLEAIEAAQPFDTDRVLLIAGRLEGYKQVDLAIRALAEVPGPRLVICGEGSQRTALQRLVADLGLEQRVSFLGFVATADLHRWQRTAHAVLALSRFEAFGLALVEAAVAGCHVIASDIPAHAELAPTLGTGYRSVAVTASPDEVAVAIEQVWRAPPAPAVRRGILTWRDHVQRVTEVYQTVLSGAE